jgi:hypothetical protein
MEGSLRVLKVSCQKWRMVEEGIKVSDEIIVL